MPQTELNSHDMSLQHEAHKDKETTPDIQDTAPDVYVNSVNSTCVVDVDVDSQKALYPLHMQARTSPIRTGSPSSTCFDKHLVDS